MSTHETRAPRTIAAPTALALSLSLCLLPVGVRSEERPGPSELVRVGSRVRLRAPTVVAGGVKGRVTAIDESVLVISADDRRVTVPRRAITRLEVSTRRTRNTGRGALIGVLIGTPVSIALMIGGARDAAANDYGKQLRAGAIAGVLEGALLGSLSKGERWTEVPLSLVRTDSGPSREGALTTPAASLPEGASTDLRAQRPAPTSSSIVAGSTVRLRAPAVPAGHREWVVVDVDEHSLSLRNPDDGARLRVPRETITALDVSIGRRSRAREGALIGAAIGAAIGAVRAARAEPGVNLPVAGISGAAMGALIGAFVKTDRWKSVPLDRVHVSLGPTRGRGVALSVSLAF